MGKEQHFPCKCSFDRALPVLTVYPSQRCFQTTETPVFVFNSVVCVGGDGMFSEILHGVIGRTQQEAGFCENDPAVTLQPCPLHIGIIPAGYYC